MSCALNLEMRDVEKALTVANAAVTREEWLEAEGALAEVQDRVGCLVREVRLKQTSVRVPIVERPTPAGSIKPPRFYLFQSTTSDAFYAVAHDETGCTIPKLSTCSGDEWLLRGEIRFDDFPADVVVITNTRGYCLLNLDEIKGGAH